MARGLWIPNQHGAWAMLVLPCVVGAVRSGGSWAQVPLFLFWMTGYFAFFATGTWMRSRRRSRFVRPVQVYAAVAALLGILVVVVRPDLMIWVPVFLPLAATSLYFSSRRQDRRLANDFVTILAACLFGLVTYSAGDSFPGWAAPGGRLMLAFFVVLLSYFLGTVLYVKTLIRERDSRGFRVASIAYHAAWTVAWTGWAMVAGEAWWWAVAVLFGGLTARAAIMAGRAVRPMHVGLAEMAVCAVILALCASWPYSSSLASSSSVGSGAVPAAVAYPVK